MISEQPNTTATSQPPRDPSSTLRQKAGGQSATYAAALTTPQVVISEQPNTTATAQPLRASTAFPDLTSFMQTEREERQSLVMSASFIRQQIEADINDLMQKASKQLAEIVKPLVRNEMQLVQQQQKEISQTYGHSAEAMQ